jgi:hypothetical protein
VIFDPETGMRHAPDTKGFSKITNFGHDWLLRSENLFSRRFKGQKIVFELRNVYALWPVITVMFYCSIDSCFETIPEA